MMSQWLSSGSHVRVLIIFSLFQCHQSLRVVRGPSPVTFNDDNGTSVTVDLSDVEFYPVQDFPLLAFSRNSGSGEVVKRQTASEKQSIKRLSNRIAIDRIDGLHVDRILSTTDPPQLHTPTSDPIHHTTPDDSHAYRISSLTSPESGAPLFSSLSPTAEFGQQNVRPFARAQFQDRVTTGRDVQRFAVRQSLNSEGAPRSVWLADGIASPGKGLEPVGRVTTAPGHAVFWSSPNSRTSD